MNEEYKEMDLLELIKEIFSNWWLILMLTILSAGISYYITSEKIEPIYEASATLFIGKESSSLSDISINDLQVGNQLISDYSELINTNQVTEKVIQELGLVASPEDLIENMGVETIKESRFMHITFQDLDPKVATQIANKLSEILTEKAVQIVGVKNIQIVDYAKVPTEPVSPSILMNVGIAGILGFMIAIFVIFLKMMFINYIQKEEDVEREIGLPVLGMIPKFKGEERV